MNELNTGHELELDETNRINEMKDMREFNDLITMKETNEAKEMNDTTAINECMHGWMYVCLAVCMCVGIETTMCVYNHIIYMLVHVFSSYTFAGNPG